MSGIFALVNRILVERLQECLRYEPDTGALVWLVSRGKCKAGDTVTCQDSRGYLVLGLDGVRHYAHRVAWALAYGVLPDGVVDHIDGDRSNNRLSNLRAVSVMVNTQNRHVPSARSKTQLLGVRKFGKSFRAQISIEGHTTHLGTFPTAAEAHDAYLAAKRQLHEGCTI